MKYTIQQVEDFKEAAPLLLQRIEEAINKIRTGSSRTDLVEGLLELEGPVKKLREVANKAIPYLQ